jgi:ABC-2 type transport system ATP-binding protein
MIQIQQLRKSYDDLVVLNSIDLNIQEGAITGLLGPNGAGKTTLVSILTGILKKDSGIIKINNLDIEENLDEIKSISAIVPQSLALYPSLTAYENLEYFGTIYGLTGKKLKERIEFSIEVASLQGFLKKRSVRCSGGMQRRLNLAIGLLNNPKILYLDEPTVGVDAQSRQYMLEMIKKINREQKTTIIYSSHYIDEIEQISEDIIIIDNGTIILKDKLAAILSCNDNVAIHVDSMDTSIADALGNIPGIVIGAESITIDRNESFYPGIILTLTLLREKGKTVQNIQYNTDKLEQLYMQLTHKRLRDDE